MFSEAEMDAMSSVYESDAEPMPTDILQYIFDGSQYNSSVNRREEHYKIRDHFKTNTSGTERSVIINGEHG